MRSKGKHAKYPPSHKKKSLQDSKFVPKASHLILFGKCMCTQKSISAKYGYVNCHFAFMLVCPKIPRMTFFLERGE